MLGSINVRNIIAKEIAAVTVTEEEKKEIRSAWSEIMKIIMFEENLFESFSKVFRSW